MKKLVFLVSILIFFCFGITTVLSKTIPVYVDTISRVSPVPVSPKCGAETSPDVKACISCHINVEPDYLEGLTLGCRDCPESSLRDEEVQVKINLKLEVVPVDDLTYKIKGSIDSATCNPAYALEFAIYRSQDNWVTKQWVLYKWPWGRPNPTYTTDSTYNYADTTNQFKLYIKFCSSCEPLCAHGRYEMWSDPLIPSSGFVSTVTVLEDLTAIPPYSSKIDPWNVDGSYDIILSKVKYTLPAVDTYDFVTLMFGQALDGLVMNTTFVDISKPTPPDEEYPWNGTYSLRDGTDPRNGQKVPPGNYKVFVSIDGKTPSEGDKMIKVMGVDFSIEGVDDDKEETVGGFVAPNEDDDNKNNIQDKDPADHPVPGENDLKRLFINQVVNTGKIVLNAEKNGNKIALWGDKEKNGSQITLPKEWTDLTTVPKELWVEGIVPSASIDDNVILVMEYYEGGNKIQEDRVKITVMKIDVNVHPSDPDTHEIASVLTYGKEHFVCAKNTGDIILQATINPDNNDIRNAMTWEVTGATITSPAVGTDKQTAKLSSATSNKIPVKIKIGGTECWEGFVWVVWASPNGNVNAPIVTPENSPAGLRVGTQIGASFACTTTIQPVSIITDIDRPDLTGVNTVNPPGGNNAAGQPLSGGVNLKWDISRRISRRMTVNAANPALPMPVLDQNINFPADAVVGNDDAGTIDEDNNPYDNNPAQGVITSEDLPTRTFNLAGGNTGDTYQNQTWFQEFARLQIGNTWYVISGSNLWRVEFKFIKREVTEALWGLDINGDSDQNDVVTEAMLGQDTNGDGDQNDVVGYWDNNGSSSANDNAGAP